MPVFWPGEFHGLCNHGVAKSCTTLSDLTTTTIPLPTKVHLVNAMVFPVVMYGCESCTKKKAEHHFLVTLLNDGVGEDSLESLGLKEDPTSQS